MVDCSALDNLDLGYWDIKPPQIRVSWSKHPVTFSLSVYGKRHEDIEYRSLHSEVAIVTESGDVTLGGTPGTTMILAWPKSDPCDIKYLQVTVERDCDSPPLGCLSSCETGFETDDGGCGFSCEVIAESDGSGSCESICESSSESGAGDSDGTGGNGGGDGSGGCETITESVGESGCESGCETGCESEDERWLLKSRFSETGREIAVDDIYEFPVGYSYDFDHSEISLHVFVRGRKFVEGVNYVTVSPTSVRLLTQVDIYDHIEIFIYSWRCCDGC